MPLALVPGLFERPAEAAFDGPDLTRYALVCFGLLGGVLLLAWFARRFLVAGMRKRAKQRSLHVMDVLPLGGRQKLVVVRCYDRSFLLGLGDKEISSIAELDADELEPRASEAGKLGAEEAVAPPFRSALADVIREPPAPLAESLAEARRSKRAQPWKPGGILG